MLLTTNVRHNLRMKSLGVKFQSFMTIFASASPGAPTVHSCCMMLQDSAVVAFEIGGAPVHWHLLMLHSRFGICCRLTMKHQH